MEELNSREAEPPRASFLGLPVEMRLLIYSYIPGPIERHKWQPGDISDPDAAPTIICHGSEKSKALHRSTKLSADLNILAVSRQVFAEAMPVIYQNAEVVPWTSGIPEYARPYVQRVLVLCEYYSCYEQWSSLPTVTGNFSTLDVTQVWPALSANFPRIRQLRLQIYLTADLLEWEFSTLRVLQGILGFASLDTVIVGTHWPTDPNRGADSTKRQIQLERLSKSCITEVEQQARGVRRDITTIEEKLDESTCLVCMKGLSI